jgi:type II secretory pathway predicted ATPase ExeA
MPYRANYNLNRAPFSPEIEPHALFQSEGHTQCRARLDYLRRERGLAVITGEVGSGKSTVLRSFLRQLAPSSYLTLYGAVPAVPGPLRPIVEGWLENLGERLPFNNLARCLHILHENLGAIYEKGRQPFLVIDEAHLLDKRSLLQLKPLLNYDMDSRLPLTMVLSGGPQLARSLSLPPLEEIRQRVLFAYPLPGLKRVEIEQYLSSRLKHAGCDRQLFPEEIVDEIFRHTQGIPRRVNQLANLCLVAAASRRLQLVDSASLLQALGEMGLAEETRRDSFDFATAGQR